MTLSTQLPTRRDEAWKWTDISRVVSDDMRGLSVAAPVQIFVPEGVSVTRVDAETAANDATLYTLATEHAGQVYAIDVLAEFSSEHPIQIEGLTHGHAQISLNVGKGARIQLVEHYDGTASSCKPIRIQPSVPRRPMSRLGRVLSLFNIHLPLAVNSLALKPAWRGWGRA